MDDEHIEPWHETYRERYHGTVVETIGVDTKNQRVIYRRQGYEHPCVCPRRDWKKKFERVL